MIKLRKIKYTKTGQPYIILANGRAKFISGKRKIKEVKTMARRKVRRVSSYGKVKRSKPSNSILGINANTIWMGVGAGTGGLLGGILDQTLGMNFGSNLSQGLLGLGLNFYGKGAIKQAGKGMIISSVGQIVSEQVVPMVMGRTSIGNNSNNWLQ